MIPLPYSSTDEQLVEIVHHWVRLLESEQYQEAFLFTDHMENSGWTPENIKQCIESYGEAVPK
jgi:hypothetical protein